MTPGAILIPGAASGIGAEFLRYYHERTSSRLIVVDLAPIELPEGPTLSGRAEAFAVDVTSEKDVTQLAITLLWRPIETIPNFLVYILAGVPTNLILDVLKSPSEVTVVGHAKKAL
jgi:hypothetical protein